MDHDHLNAVVGRFVASGNRPSDGGFRPTQGGWECGFVDPLDPVIARSAIAADRRLEWDEPSDELSCSHCWAKIYGGRAAARYIKEWSEATKRASEP